MRRASSVVLLLLALPLTLAGCAETPTDEPGPSGGTPVPSMPATSTPATVTTATTPNPPTQDGRVVLRVLEHGAFSEISTPVRSVFNDGESWGAFYRQHAKKTYDDNATASPPRPPEVDFSRERAVVATLGDKGSSCWAVRITNATTEAGVTTLTVTTYTPPPGFGCAAVVTQPYTMVAIPADGSEVAFKDEEKQGPVPK